LVDHPAEATVKVLEVTPEIRPVVRPDTADGWKSTGE
jgi:hypothetical protein